MVTAVVLHFALASALAFGLAVASVLRQTFLLLFDAASFLELNVDGIWGLVSSSSVDPYSIPSQPWPESDKQAAELLLESLVEVEVYEWVVDVGALGEEGWEYKAFGSHVPGLIVENKEEGHNGVWCPGDHKTQTDAEKHLGEEVNNYQLY